MRQGLSEVVLDGAAGEGGGQVLRSALTLSMATGRALRIDRIRARRPRPGLARQHLAAVRAAAAVCGAEVSGDVLGSTALTFVPGPVRGGEHRFAIGSAGSTTLVLQTVLLPLLAAAEPSVLVIEGGTHNPWSPPYPFVERVFLPLLRGLGARVDVALHRAGFFPNGGGSITVRIAPSPRLAPLRLDTCDGEARLVARAVVAGLPRRVGSDEIDELGRRLRLEAGGVDVRPHDEGPGNVCWVEVARPGCTELLTGFGRKGVHARRIASELAVEVERFVAARVPVGRWLADQLLLPLALGSGGRFTTELPDPHLGTNAEVIRRFVDIDIDIAHRDGHTAVRVGSVSA